MVQANTPDGKRDMSWDDMADTWDTLPSVRAYSSGAFRSLSEVCAARGVSLDGARVIDFGCGTGLLTEAVAAQAQDVVGVDVSPAMVAVLQGKGLPNVRVECGELNDIIARGGLPHGAFDLVVASSVCGFLADYPAAVALLAARLAPGGLFIQWDWELDPTADEPMGLTRDAIQDALVAAGLDDVVVDVGFHAPFEDMVMAPLRGVGRMP